MVDTHAHAWDTGCRYVADAGYHPASIAPFERLMALWSAHGVTRGVLVQPSFLGPDNGYLLMQLDAYPSALRGVIIAEPARDAADIDRLHALGVRGFRFNLISGGPLPDLASKDWRRFANAAADHGWHVVAAGSSAELGVACEPLLDLGLPLVVDHFGLPDPELGPSCPDWRRLLRIGAGSGRFSLKATAHYRLGGVLPADLWPTILDSLPVERLLWGSDWPWTRHEAGRSFAETQARPFDGAGHLAARAVHRNAAVLYEFPMHAPETGGALA